MSKNGICLNDVKEAKERISKYIHRTPLIREEQMDEFVGCKLYLKPEMLQVTGAFKIRGAMNKILSLTDEERARGIITSSSGNHAQACAYAGQLLNIKATVLIPEDAPTVKIENARKMGADVILWDRSYDARWKRVYELVEEKGYTVVHGYEDYYVMAGQGTIALEIMEDLPDVDTVIVPIGGGGLISGISTAIKETNPNIRVIGVQTEASCAFAKSREAGKKVSIVSKETLADGITCGTPGDNTYPIVEKYVDEIVTVSEDGIKNAIKLISNKAKLLAEPASSVTVAALLENKIKLKENEKVVSLLTSGNWNLEKFAKLYLDEEIHGVTLKSAK